MVTKMKIAGLVMALIALSAPIVYADNDSGDKNSWHHGHGDHMMVKILGLTQDQEKQLKDIQKKQKEAMKSVFEQMKSSGEAFNAEIVKGAPDMGKINTIQTQIKALQSQMFDNHLNSLLEIKKIMTPEQFAGYMALKEEREMKMRHEHKGGFNKGKDGDKDKGHSFGDQD